MKSLKFPQGEMPILGLGTWKMDDGAAVDAVSTALRVGYRHIDCAPIYLNEKEVGQAMAQAFSEGVVNREDLWITSKLWCNRHEPDRVEGALKQTLADLGVDYLDLFMIHWPVAFRADIGRPESPQDFVPLDRLPLIETWRAMEACVEQGLCRNLGVCNFSRQNLKVILDGASVPLAANQVECHPYLKQTQLLEFCQENGIHLVAYSPLGSGDRPERMRDDADPNLFADETLKQIASARQRSVGQILLAWAVNRGTAVIPKSTNPGRLSDNLASAEIELTDEEMQAIESIPQRHRFVHGKFWEMPGGPYTAAGIWGDDES